MFWIINSQKRRIFIIILSFFHFNWKWSLWRNIKPSQLQLLGLNNYNNPSQLLGYAISKPILLFRLKQNLHNKSHKDRTDEEVSSHVSNNLIRILLFKKQQQQQNERKKCSKKSFLKTWIGYDQSSTKTRKTKK